MKDKIFEKFKKELPEIQTGVLLKDYTTFKIGGPAKYFFVAKNKEDLITALKFAKKNKLQVFILGGGSNLLVSDKGFRGLVIKVDIKNIEFENNKSLVGAGADLTKLTYLLAEKGLSGLEWSAGIPSATVGGAIYGHAQAFGTKISDVIKEVIAVDLKILKLKKFSKKQCQFSLKNSVFKKTKNFVIISAVLELQKKDTEEIKNKIKEFLEYRKNGHPINFPSAGSVFVNPENKKEAPRAGNLIEKAGLKGKRIGGAQISELHANFVVNLGNAKAKDVLALIKLAQKKVKKTFSVSLETEIQFIGF